MLLQEWRESPAAPSLARQSYAGQVTSVLFVAEDTLMCAIGPFVHQMHWRTGQRVASRAVFSTGRVYGLHTSRSQPTCRVLAHSLRNVAVLSVVSVQGGSDQHAAGSSSVEYHAPDRILGLADAEVASQDVLLVALARNRVHAVLAASGTVLWSVQHSQRCLLYCMQLTLTERSDASGMPAAMVVTAACGTIYNNVLVWQADVAVLPHAAEAAVPDVRTLCELSGHRGVVFDVALGPPQDSSASLVDVIASCSDDRAVRIWRSGTCTAEMYGHAHRVWRVRWAAWPFVVSVADDTACRVWDASQGACVAVLADGHGGRSIWALDVQVGAGVIATGGNDSSVKLASVTSRQSALLGADVESFCPPFWLPDASAASRNSVVAAERDAKVSRKHTDDTLMAMDLLDPDTLYVATRFGLVYCVAALRRGSSERTWHVVLRQPQHHWQSLCADPQSNRVAVGDLAGHIVLLDAATRDPIAAWDTGDAARIVTLVWPRADVLLAACDSGVATLWDVSGAAPGFLRRIAGDRSSRLTSAVLLASSGILVTGAWSGFLAVWSGDAAATAPAHVELRAHGKGCVGALCVRTDSREEAVVVSAGFDCTIATWRVSIVGAGVCVTLLARAKQQVVPLTLATLAIPPASRDVIAGGWFAKRFVLWNVTHAFPLLDVDAGGGRRPWALRHNPAHDAASADFAFVFLRARQLHLVHGQHSGALHPGNAALIPAQAPGRVATHAAWLDAECAVVASDDTLVRVLHMPRDAAPPQAQLCLAGHANGVKRVLVLHDAPESCVIISVGSKQVLMAWRLPRHNVTQLAYRTLVRYQDRVNEDDDCRFLAVAAVPLSQQPGVYHLLLGSSDSSVQLMRFDARAAAPLTSCPLWRSTAHQCAVLCGAAVAGYGLTGGSDGRIAVWRVADAAVAATQPIAWLTMHASGICAIDAATTDVAEPTHYLVASGGDDHHLAVVLVHADCDSVVEVERVQVAAAASAVRGVVLLPSQQLVLTASLDQRVSVWQLQMRPLRLRILTSVMTDVTEVSSLAYNPHARRVIVAGCGVQTFRLGVP